MLNSILYKTKETHSQQTKFPNTEYLQVYKKLELKYVYSTLTSTIVLEVLADDFHVLNAREAYSDSVDENLAESRLSGGKRVALVAAVAIERLLI